MQGSNRSGLQCFEHPNQQITNYCLHYDCLRPLCPDCVQIHTKQHQTQQIQSWKHCINKSAKSVKTTLDNLKSIYDQQTRYKGFKSVDMIEGENIKKLNQLKQKIIKIVKDAFDSIQQRLRTVIRSHHKIDPPDTTKLKLAIQELQKILMRLGHTTTVLPALKKSLQLDHQSLLNYFGDMKYNERKGPIKQIYIQQNYDCFAKVKMIVQNCANITGAAHIDGNDYMYRSPYHHNNQQEFHIARQSPTVQNPLKINRPDYFNSQCKFKFLHFFIPKTKYLKIIELQQIHKNKQWRTLQYKSKTDLPEFCQSIITPQGQIYVIGGALQQKKCKEIYKYYHEKNTLELICKMKFERSSHTLCYMNNAIYILGGFLKNGQQTKQCQIFKLETQNCQMISPMLTPCANACAAPFNNEYIYKFGGLIDTKTNPSNYSIEMYSVKMERWQTVNIETTRNIPNIPLLSCSSALQINQRQILVFGGYRDDQDQKPEKICYSIIINQNKTLVTIKDYNTYPLTYAQGFWSNNSIIYKNNVYALQNVADIQNDNQLLSQERKIIIFNGERWL